MRAGGPLHWRALVFTRRLYAGALCGLGRTASHLSPALLVREEERLIKNGASVSRGNAEPVRRTAESTRVGWNFEKAFARTFTHIENVLQF